MSCIFQQAPSHNKRIISHRFFPHDDVRAHRKRSEERCSYRWKHYQITFQLLTRESFQASSENKA